MQKIFLVLFVCILVNSAFAQCGRNVRIICKQVFTLSEGEWREVPAEGNVELNGNEIKVTLSTNGEAGTMFNHIDEVTYCKWTNFLQDGKSVYKATSHTTDSQSTISSVITIENVDGAISITCREEPDNGNQVKIIATEFEDL